MGPPEEQLEQDSRDLLSRTVQALYKAKPEMFANNPGLLQLAGVQ